MRVPNAIHSYILLLLAMSSIPHAIGQTTVTTLAQLRDTTRPLLIFAPKPDDPQLGLQLQMLNEHAAEAHDRQIVPIALPLQGPSPTPAVFASQDAVAARRRFHVSATDFTVILIGKDGGAKLQSSKPVPMARLKETIDAMPMRQDEMHGKL